MEQKINNRLEGCNVKEYIGGNQTNNYYTMYQESEREFVVTHNANIKPVSYFVGRETELQDLRQRIEDGRKAVLVSGMGGIGKTHICRKLFEEYLNRHAENGPFQHIGYIEYDGDMGSSLQNCLKFKQQNNPEQNQEAAWQELEYLASGGKLLLFVDNVDKPIREDSGLQRLKGIPGAVVLTSRQASFGDEFELYPIGFLDMEQCKEIYEKIRFRGSGKKVNLEEVEDLEYVIENLAGRHTITVELLAHLARTKTWPVRKLREKLEEKGFCLEFHKDGELINIQESYEALYDLSELTGAEQNILEAFSVFPYIPLAAETCDEWLLADAGASEDDDILMGLYQKGWLQFDAEQEGYALHPVFAQFIYDKCSPNTDNHLGLIRACQNNLEISNDGTTLECRKFIPFGENIAERMNFGDDVKKWAFLYTLAVLLYRVAEYQKAEKYYKILLKILKDREQRDSLIASDIYSRLAGIYESQGKYRRARNIYEKSLKILENLPEKKLDSIAIIYNNLAGIYADQGEYRKSEEFYVKALSMLINIYGENHWHYVRCASNLARLFINQCEFDKAKNLLEKNIAILDNGDEGNLFDIANNYNHLSRVYAEMGEYRKAEKMCMRGLKIRKGMVGEHHPDTAISYATLGEVYECQGKYERAEELYKKSIEIWEGIPESNYSDIATGYSCLAGMYMGQEKFTEAKELYEKCVWSYERVYGENNWQTAVFYNQLARLNVECGEYDIALIYYLKAYKAFALMQGLKHPNTQIFYNHMEIVYYKWNPAGNFKQWLEEKMKE